MAGAGNTTWATAEASRRLHMPSIWAPSSTDRVLCSTSPVTLAVFSSTTWSALIAPLTTPQIRTVSACSAPCTVAPSPITMLRLWMSPSTQPSTCTSPLQIRSPLIRRSALMMDGTDDFGVERTPSLLELAEACLLPFENISTRLQECHGVERTAIVANLEMDVRPGRPAGATQLADLLSIIDDIPYLHVNGMKVGVAGDDAEPVVDLDHPPVTAFPAGEFHGARRGRQDFGPQLAHHVDAFVDRALPVEGVHARAIGA